MNLSAAFADALEEPFSVHAEPLRSICKTVYVHTFMGLDDFAVPTVIHVMPGNFDSIPYLNCFETLQDALRKDFQIVGDDLKMVLVELDKAIKVYATYAAMPQSYKGLVKSLERLSGIERAADRLLGLLPHQDDLLIKAFDMAYTFEPPNVKHEPAAEFVRQLKKSLRRLRTAKALLHRSRFGHMLQIGHQTPKSNLALKAWMATMLFIWTRELGRSVSYDGPDGVSGKTRFLDFCHTCLVHVDTRVEYYTIENAYRADPDCGLGPLAMGHHMVDLDNED